MTGSLQAALETILVVDDNEDVRKIVISILQCANFRVLSADNGATALKLANYTDGRIDLLLSHVDMPHLSGPDLGEILKKTRPDIHVILMSGSADRNLLVRNYGWAFIQKPFAAVRLVEMVMDVLHSANHTSRW